MANFSALVLPFRKICTRCGHEKALTDFHRNAKTKDGRQSRCKTCECERRKERYYTEWVKKYGMQEADRRLALWQRKQDLAPGLKICARCEEAKELTDFHQNAKLKDGRNSYCISCSSELTKGYHSRSPEDRLSLSLNTSRVSARSRGLVHEINVSDLIQLWEQQQGCCYYTGFQMVYDGGGGPRSVSLDRVDSSKGYTKANVVLCCVYVNRMKNDQPTDEFVNWCQSVVDHHEKKYS